MNLKLFGEAFVTLLVIIDPPGMVPIFLALTGPMTAKARHRAGWQAVALAGGVIVTFAVAGQQILHYLGIDLPAGSLGGLLDRHPAPGRLFGRAEAREPTVAEAADAPQLARGDAAEPHVGR